MISSIAATSGRNASGPTPRGRVRPVTLSHLYSIASSIPPFVCSASSVAAAFPSLPRSDRPQPEGVRIRLAGRNTVWLHRVRRARPAVDAADAHLLQVEVEIHLWTPRELIRVGSLLDLSLIQT